ncbi:MAG: 4-hydroxy-3-methylbut-2-enyl diphosphate reductase, partial [Verrucomicrobiota bacterium]
ETRRLGELIKGDSLDAQRQFEEIFAGRFTPGFNVVRDLQRVAVVNQTTLLMNETLEIIEFLRATYRNKFGDDTHVGGGARRDTLCYATQVNQDALGRALNEPLDAAFVIGGKNSSNTYQLFHLCEAKLGARAFFIQSEASLVSREAVDHYVYGGGGNGRIERRALWPASETSPEPKRILITGGASCPDGIIQQVITRINSLFPPGELRPLDEVLADLR